MKSELSSSRTQPSPNLLAFTLAELLVVIVIIAMLLVCLLPAMARGTNRTRIAECSSNVRQLVLASHIYGNEYNEKLPPVNGGFWNWDIGGTAINVYTQYVSWETFYCPDTGFDYNNNWALWNYGPSHVISYGSTFPGAATLIASNANPAITPQPIPNGLVPFPPPHPANRVLVPDATISPQFTSVESNKYTYAYTGIQGAYTHRTSHMDGSLPAGGNMGMLDGHVEWRKFDDMHIRTTPGGTPTFWW
jgi:prepilin-type processing-associated H-X9-DG protein